VTMTAAVPAMQAHGAVAAAPAAAVVADPARHPGCVKSPMVGSAYLSPEPGAPPFAEVGSRVTAGQTLLIIEAMKTMNHIPAPKAGIVTQVFIENGQPVEFGEPLVIIE
jgi:acetyl-CoA carboxylase biotin carboxyl carrier protein